jgi:hypothetical protein
MRDYLTLHLDTNLSRGTACSKKGYRCKWTRETIQHYTYTQIKVKEQLVVRKDIDVNEHERHFNLCLSVMLNSL